MLGDLGPPVLDAVGKLGDLGDAGDKIRPLICLDLYPYSMFSFLDAWVHRVSNLGTLLLLFFRSIPPLPI